MIAGWLFSIFYDIISSFQKQQHFYLSVVQKEHMQRGYEYIRENYKTPDFNYKELCRATGLEYAYFSKLFKKTFKMSPVRFVTKMRIDYAKELLITNRRSVSEIAEICGFSNTYYFSNVFKKQTGFSPTQCYTSACIRSPGRVICSYGFGVYAFGGFSCGNSPVLRITRNRAFRAAGIPALFQPMPQFKHAKLRISTAHIPHELQLSLGMLAGMAVGASGLAGEGGCRSIPALFPKADVGAAFIVFAACSTDTVLFGVFH